MDCDSRAKCNDGKCICQGNTTGNGKFCRGNSPWKDWVLAFDNTYCNQLLQPITKFMYLVTSVTDLLLVISTSIRQPSCKQACWLKLSQKSQLKGSVRTNAFLKVCVFVVIENASIDSRPHYCLMRFRQAQQNVRK